MRPVGPTKAAERSRRASGRSRGSPFLDPVGVAALVADLLAVTGAGLLAGLISDRCACLGACGVDLLVASGSRLVIVCLVITTEEVATDRKRDSDYYGANPPKARGCPRGGLCARIAR